MCHVGRIILQQSIYGNSEPFFLCLTSMWSLLMPSEYRNLTLVVRPGMALFWSFVWRLRWSGTGDKNASGSFPSPPHTRVSQNNDMYIDYTPLPCIKPLTGKMVSDNSITIIELISVQAVRWYLYQHYNELKDQTFRPADWYPLLHNGVFAALRRKSPKFSKDTKFLCARIREASLDHRNIKACLKRNPLDGS